MYKLLFFSFFYYCVSAQEDIIHLQWIQTDSIVCEQFFGVDDYKQVYYSYQNTLYKKGVQMYQYKNVAFGTIHDVDCKNPLQIVVFYKNMNRVVVLDNQLNEIHHFDANQLELQVQLENVQLAAQNSLWFFDSISQRVGLYNLNTKQLKFITPVLPFLIQNATSTFNNYYFTDSNHSLYVVNLYGVMERLEDFRESTPIFMLSPQAVLYKQGIHLFVRDFQKKINLKIPLVENSFDFFFANMGNLSIFTNGEWKTYKLKL